MEGQTIENRTSRLDPGKPGKKQVLRGNTERSVEKESPYPGTSFTFYPHPIQQWLLGPRGTGVDTQRE